MLIPTIIMGVAAAAFLAVGIYQGDGRHIAGMQAGFRIFLSIIPLLFFAMIVAGMIQVLLPQGQISKWVGDESGFRGLLIGSLAGGLTPGGPFVSFPIVAGLYKAGASVGTLVAYTTAWSLWAVARLPMEVGILGWKLTLIRLICTSFFPPLAGYLAQTFFSGWKV